MSVVWLFVCMNAHSVVEDWDPTAFEGGFSGLESLAARGFDGAVEAAGTWLFLRDGEPIAVVSDLESAPRPADLDAFEGAAGTGYEAPTSAAVTLAAMLALDGEVRGRYFTDDTPLSAVHDTLSGGGFTGYVELSENVLSGDYYYVYVDGEVEYVGFVGSSQRLYGEKAQQRAENEVGIYAVVAVSLPDLELPDPEPEPEPEPEPDEGPTPVPKPGADPDPEAESASPADDEPEPAAGVDADPVPPSDTDASSDPDPVPDPGPGSNPPPGAESEPDADPTTEPGSPAESDSRAASDPEDDADPTTAAGTPSDPTDDPTDDPPDAGPTSPEAPTDADSDDDPTEADSDDNPTEADADTSALAPPESEPSEPSDSSADANSAREQAPFGAETKPEDEDPTTGTTPEPYPSADGSTTPATGSGGSRRTESGLGDLTTREVPSLDPERSEHGRAGADETSRGGGTVGESANSKQIESTDAPGESASRSHGAAIDELEGQLADREERIDGLETELSARNDRIDELESELADREGRIEDLESELEAVRAERDELEARLETQASGFPAVGESLTVQEALAGTSLFVRERVRGEATLEDAHAGAADREALAENLRIEYHTTFDSADVTVEGEPFETWLRSSAPYEFAEWLVGELLFEIRSTDNLSGLRPLYDALPTIDRVGFDETIPVDDEDDEDDGASVHFDIVARDRKGNPIVVAHFDQKRDPTRADTIGPFVTDSSDVCQAHGTLAAAVAVSSSYFEADAMGAAEEATSSSLLSRSKHRSYVTLSRSNGYHLCLVEARDDSFNLTVPEL